MSMVIKHSSFQLEKSKFTDAHLPKKTFNHFLDQSENKSISVANLNNIELYHPNTTRIESKTPYNCFLPKNVNSTHFVVTE